jgi:hypothetical protein
MFDARTLSLFRELKVIDSELHLFYEPKTLLMLKSCEQEQVKLQMELRKAQDQSEREESLRIASLYPICWDSLPQHERNTWKLSEKVFSVVGSVDDVYASEIATQSSNWLPFTPIQDKAPPLEMQATKAKSPTSNLKLMTRTTRIRQFKGFALEDAKSTFRNKTSFCFKSKHLLPAFCKGRDSGASFQNRSRIVSNQIHCSFKTAGEPILQSETGV